MWFFAALFIGSFILMTLLAPKPKLENAKASSLSDFNFPRAKEGDPVPEIFGTVKTKGPNAIYLGDFEAKPITKKVKTGLFSSKKQIVGYKYYSGLDLAIALGPCVEIRRLFSGKNEIWNGCLFHDGCTTAATVVSINLPDLYGGQDQNGGIAGDIAIYSGSFDQEADPYLISQLETGDDPDLVPAYVGICHLVFRKFYWGNSTSVEAISAEARRFTNTLGIGLNKHYMANGLDANPMEVLYYLYTNDWGNLDIDPTLIDVDNWREAALVVYDEDNGFSAEIANPQQGADVTKEILNQINAMLYQDPSSGLFKIKLIRADYDISTLPTLGPSEIVEVRNFTKTLWEDTYNRVRVKFTDRSQDYKDDVPAVANDFANIRFQKRLRATDIGMPGVKVAANANRLAARELSNRNVPLFQGELVVNREASVFGPGGVFKLNWPEYGIASVVVRIRKFGLGLREDGKVTMTIMQDEFASDQIVYAEPAPSIGTSSDYTPQDIGFSNVFELPTFLYQAIGETPVVTATRYAAFAKKPSSASIDYFGLTTETGGDIEVLSNSPYVANAKLSASVGKYLGFVAGVIPSLIIKQVSDVSALTTQTEAVVRTGHNLFYLNDEIFAYEDFADNGDGTYTLTNVLRALLDTTYNAHAMNDVLYFFDGQEGFIEQTFAVPSSTDLYLLDRTYAGRSAKASAALIPLAPVSPPRAMRPAPPDYVQVAAARALGDHCFEGDALALTWRERNRLDAAIALEGDATEAAEAATTYKAGLYQGGTEIVAATGIVGTSESLTVPMGTAAGLYEIRVWAYRDTFASFTPAVYPINVVSADTLTIDDDPVTIDGDTIEF